MKTIAIYKICTLESAGLKCPATLNRAQSFLFAQRQKTLVHLLEVVASLGLTKYGHGILISWSGLTPPPDPGGAGISLIPVCSISGGLFLYKVTRHPIIIIVWNQVSNFSIVILLILMKAENVIKSGECVCNSVPVLLNNLNQFYG